MMQPLRQVRISISRTIFSKAIVLCTDLINRLKKHVYLANRNTLHRSLNEAFSKSVPFSLDYPFKELVRFAFDFLNLEKIVAETRVDNIANIKLNEKIGFKVIGKKEFKGTEFYIMGILPADFFNKLEGL